MLLLVGSLNKQQQQQQLQSFLADRKAIFKANLRFQSDTHNTAPPCAARCISTHSTQKQQIMRIKSYPANNNILTKICHKAATKIAVCGPGVSKTAVDLAFNHAFNRTLRLPMSIPPPHATSDLHSSTPLHKLATPTLAQASGGVQLAACNLELQCGANVQVQ